jgi:hypothetical protein
MGGSYDAKMLAQQGKLAQQQAARNTQLYNPDGSGRANDYHPPKLPASTFPHLAAGKDLVVHRDRLTQVATAMAAELSKLQATLQRLYGEGAGGSLLGGWPTADALGNNAGSAYEGISQFYQDLNTAYNLVISNIHQTVSNYADAESSTASAASGIGT